MTNDTEPPDDTDPEQRVETLQSRVDRLEEMVRKMAPSRRDFLKMGGGAAAGLATGMAATGSAAADNDQKGIRGSPSYPADDHLGDIFVQNQSTGDGETPPTGFLTLTFEDGTLVKVAPDGTTSTLSTPWSDTGTDNSQGGDVYSPPNASDGIDVGSANIVELSIDGNQALLSRPVSGQVQLSSGSAVVDTTLSATDATIYLALGIDDPNADAKVAGRLFWDDSAGTYKVEIVEDGTSVGNPTVNYDVLRVR